MTQKVNIKVKPGSKKGSFVQTSLTGDLLVYVKEPAVDGMANSAIVKLMADYYDTAKSNVKIVGGLKSRNKIIEISN